jgi:hypothetical protein
MFINLNCNEIKLVCQRLKQYIISIVKREAVVSFSFAVELIYE